ncbi:hypothetical protein LN042_33540 [Kitasatospora sp. RB6PN24]|uniref:hypothetical protein n=1 Tax=Kitasatospora humi TaxID=2893891 RepID=UPI001E5DE247|nr:hypothetical protein [Kitasatospora humi]MCC9311930.1 hypothetical protein [Kitasatospora humi]
MTKEPAGCDHPQGTSVGQYNCWKNSETEVHFEVEEWPAWKARRLAEILFNGLLERAVNESSPPAE